MEFQRWYNGAYFVPKVLCLFIKYIENAMKQVLTRNIIKPNLMGIIENILIPLMFLTTNDEKL